MVNSKWYQLFAEKNYQYPYASKAFSLLNGYKI